MDVVSPEPEVLLVRGQQATRYHRPPLPFFGVVLSLLLVGGALIGPQPRSHTATPAGELAAAGALVYGGALSQPAARATQASLATARLNAPVAAAPRSRPVAPKPTRFVRPDSGPLSSPFGARWGKVHEGIDLAGPNGSPIRAVAAGVVTYAGPATGYGRLITIRQADGTVTAYGHMSKILVSSGRVGAGEVIAREGAAGDATGPHLHFEVRVHGLPVNPIPWLRARGIRI